jgi:hypothetical protein
MDLCIQPTISLRRGFPIRTSADQRSLASPRGFSQRATSFIASWRQGIHRTPLSRSRTHPTPPARRTKPRRMIAHPRPPGPCAAGAGTTLASANLHTHRTNHPTPPQDLPKGRPLPPGRTIRPPNPIHRLKEHAHTRPKARAGNLRGKSRTKPNGKARFAWRLADSNR